MDALQGSKNGRILGLDLGALRIGVAVSDELRVLAKGIMTLRLAEDSALLKKLAETVRQFEISEIVIGLPLNMDGSCGEAAACVRQFAAKLRETLNLPVRLIDERLSTVEADEIRRANPRKRLRRRRQLHKDPGQDAHAAAVILQRYLDGEKSEASDG